MKIRSDSVWHQARGSSKAWICLEAFFLLVTIYLILPIATSHGLQVQTESNENERILQYLEMCGASVVAISEDGQKTPARPDDLRKGRIVVNLIDASSIRGCLFYLNQVPAKQTLVIGNSTANFDLDTILDLILQSQSIEHLVLDSVDGPTHGDNQVTELGITIQRIDNTAFECVNCSYAFAQGKASASFQTVVVSDGSTTEWFEPVVTTVFIGREWHPEPILPLPRDAVRFFRHFRHLKEVRFSGIQICDDDLTVLSNCSRLESLKLDGCPLNGSGLRFINGRNLVMLSLSEIKTLETLPYDSFPQLKQLRLDECNGGMGILEGIGRCRQLDALDLGTMRWSCEDLARVLGGMTSLKEIVLLPCETVGVSVDEFENEVKSQFPGVKFRFRGTAAKAQ